jgi:hypothetical protein
LSKAGLSRPRYFRDNAQMSANSSNRSRRKTLLSVLLAFSSFGLGATIDAIARHTGDTGWSLWADDFVGALVLGLVIFLYERRRESELVEKLKVIELMNHHVRNALQPIMYLPYSQDQQLQLNTIRDAVHRIDWALREILPGERKSPTSDQTAA